MLCYHSGVAEQVPVAPDRRDHRPLPGPAASGSTDPAHGDELLLHQVRERFRREHASTRRPLPSSRWRSLPRKCSGRSSRVSAQETVPARVERVATPNAWWRSNWALLVPACPRNLRPGRRAAAGDHGSQVDHIHPMPSGTTAIPRPFDLMTTVFARNITGSSCSPKRNWSRRDGDYPGPWRALLRLG